MISDELISMAGTLIAGLVIGLMLTPLLRKAEPKTAEGLNPALLLGLIKTRRSIFPKDYNGSAPPIESLEMMLEAANWAPTHGKTEPWRFTVLSGDSLKKFNELSMDAMKTKLGANSEKFASYAQKQERKAKDKAKVAYLITIGMKRRANPEKEMPGKFSQF